MSVRRLFIIVASIAVSAFTLALILRDIPIGEVTESLRAADARYLLLSFASVTLALLARGYRWRELLNRRISPLQATHLVNVMFLGNQLPLRAGEVARAVLARRVGVPLATAATSVVVERLIDALLVVWFITATVSQLPDAPREVTAAAAVLGLLALVGFLALMLLARKPQLAHRLLETFIALAPPLARLPLKSLADDTLAGLQPLTDLRRLTWTAIWSACAWLLSFASFYALHLALNIEVNYVLSVPLGMSLSAVSIALPVSIAAVGPFEASIVLNGQLVGMAPLDAIALGFLLHAVAVGSYAIWGTIGLIALSASPRSAFRPQAEEADIDN